MTATQYGQGPLRTFDVQPTMDTGAFADGDLLFDVQELAELFTPFDQSVLVQSLMVLDLQAQEAPFDVLFVRAGTTWGTANLAAAPGDSVTAQVVGVVSVAAADYVALGSGSSVALPQFNPFHVVSTGPSLKSLWVAAISRGSPTYAADGLRLHLGLLRS